MQGETKLPKRMVPLALLTMILFALSGTRLDTMSALASDAALSGTNVGGAITTNTTWTLSGSPYRVTADILVLVGVFLNIEPGVTVKFENGTNIVLDGTLTAQGDSAHKILFTSSAISPALGDWGNIRTRTGGRIVSVMWATIEYSSGGIEFPADSSRTVSDCVFHENGAGISGSNVNVTRCTFERNTNGVNATNVQVVDCGFVNNTNSIIGSGPCAVQNTNVWNNSGNGIQIEGTVTNCSIHDNDGLGVAATSVTNCSIFGNNEDGATAHEVANCSVYDNGKYGIRGSAIN